MEVSEVTALSIVYSPGIHSQIGTPDLHRYGYLSRLNQPSGRHDHGAAVRIEPDEREVRRRAGRFDVADRHDFAATWQALHEAGLPLRASEEAAWQHYQERRRRYAPAQEFLNALLMTPPLEK